MENPDILEWTACVVNKCAVDLFERIESFYHFSKDGGFSVQLIDVVSKGNQKLTG